MSVILRTAEQPEIQLPPRHVHPRHRDPHALPQLERPPRPPAFQAVRALAGKMDVNLRRLNIAVTDCGGRDNLPDYIWFCSQLGLPYLAAMDADAATPDAQAQAQAARDAVSTHQGGELFEFPENLETTFGVTKPRRGPSKVAEAISRLPFDEGMPDPGSTAAEVTQLAEAVKRLAKT